MSDLTFYAERGTVHMVDGPWEVRLTETQCEQLLSIWDESNAVRAFNSLYDACEKAGHVLGRPSRLGLRLVTG